MPKMAVGDSNLFYNLGNGSITIAGCLKPDEQLHYSPVTVIEIASKIKADTFAERKLAAQAIIESNAALLPDPQSHLSTLFGYQLIEAPFDWSHAVIAIAQAFDVNALETGVNDYKARVRRRVVISEALHWRETSYDEWHDEMIELMEERIPKFPGWWASPPESRKNLVPKIKKKDQAAVLAELDSDELLTELIVACQTRSFRGAVAPNVENPPPELVNSLYQAIGKIDCYCRVYIEYVKALLFDRMLPETNDAGDIELFLYLTDDDHILLTSDRRWIRLAKRAGYEGRVRRV